MGIGEAEKPRSHLRWRSVLTFRGGAAETNTACWVRAAARKRHCLCPGPCSCERVRQPMRRRSAHAGGSRTHKSRSWPTGAGRGGARAPSSRAAISSGAVTTSVSRRRPSQRGHCSMSISKTRASSAERDSRLVRARRSARGSETAAPQTSNRSSSLGGCGSVFAGRGTMSGRRWWWLAKTPA